MRVPIRCPSRAECPLGVAAAIVVATVGLALTGLVARSFHVSEARQAEDFLERRATAVEAAVAAEAKRYVDTLATLSAAVGSQSDLLAEDFATITAPLATQGLAGATGVVLVVPATDDEVEAVQAEWRARGSGGLVLRPHPGASTHLFTVLKRTLDGAESALGVDVVAAPEPSDALAAARSAGEVRASATYVLLRDRELAMDDLQQSFVLAAPVTGPASPGAPGAFRGWLLMGLHGRDFVTDTMERVAAGLVEVTLTDTTAAGERVEVASVGSTPGDGPGMVRRATIDVGGRRWQLTMRPTARLLTETEDHLDLVAVLAGLAITTLAAGLTLAVLSGRARALADVRRATASLRADIERRKVVEGELRATRDALEVADRARSEFVSTVSHELRTPLTSILGFGEMLADGEVGELTEPQDRAVAIIERNARRLLSLVEDLLSLSRIQEGGLQLDTETLDVRDLVDGVADALAGLLASRDLVVDIEQATDLGAVEGDREHLERVVFNLMANAVKYTPDGGKVQLRAHADPDAVTLVVSDTGIGIPLGEQAHLFEPFFRSSTARDAAIQGTGLGLVIVRSIVEAHGGGVELVSRPGVGTTVTVRLPIVHERAPVGSAR